MNILYASTLNLSIEKGDSLHFAQLAAALQRRGHRITVVARGWRAYDSFRPLNARLIPRLPGSRWFPQLNDALLQKVLTAYLQLGKFDILYHRGIPGANRLARQHAIPSIVEVNGIKTDELRLETGNMQWIDYHRHREAQIVRDANQVICVTKGIRDQLIQRYAVLPEKCVVIPNAADTHIFSPMPKQECRKKLGVPSDAYHIGFVGTFQHWIDFETLLQALAVLARSSIPVRCTLIGNGPKLSDVLVRTQELKLQSQIHFAGRVPHENIPCWVNAFDVCVAPFTRLRNEQIGISPLKLFEYMACERPVVATELPGISGVIRNADAGLLYAAENPKDLAAQLLALYANSDLARKFGRNGRNYVAENHSWDRVAEQIEAVMHNAINETRH